MGGAAPATEPSVATKTIQVQDNHGTQTVPVPPTSFVVTDNRLFQTVADWGLKPVAAPLNLFPASNPLKTDPAIVNLGSISWHLGLPDLVLILSAVLAVAVAITASVGAGTFWAVWT